MGAMTGQYRWSDPASRSSSILTDNRYELTDGGYEQVVHDGLRP